MNELNMDTLAGPIVRTKGRFQRVVETLTNEYWRTHKTFSRHGCSLRPIDITARSCKVATFLATFIIIVTLPPIFYYRGLTELEPYYGLGYIFVASWMLFYALVWIAHILWAASYIIGRKFGGSKYFWGIIERRWTAKIDKITEELAKNPQKVLETIEEVPEEEEHGDEDKDADDDDNDEAKKENNNSTAA